MLEATIITKTHKTFFYSVFHETKARSPFPVSGERSFVSWNTLYVDMRCMLQSNTEKCAPGATDSTHFSEYFSIMPKGNKFCTGFACNKCPVEPVSHFGEAIRFLQ